MKMWNNEQRVAFKNRTEIVVKGWSVICELWKSSSYWYLAEHGHKKANGKGLKGKTLFRITFDGRSDKMLIMMHKK